MGSRPRRLRRTHLVRPSCRHRQVISGSTIFITKKTNDDTFWLAPCPRVTAVLLYLLAIKAKKFDILVHAFQFLSNHFHLVLTDPRGRYPKFMKEFLSESSKAIKNARGTTRNIWSSQRYSCVRVLDLDAAEREVAHTLLQSMEAELTEPADWPGLTSARLRFGDSIAAKRPDFYFSKKRPEIVSLTLSPLSSTEIAREAGEEQAMGSEERIGAIVERRCEEIRRDLERRGERLAGAEKVKATPCTKQSSHPLRNLNPRFATKDVALLAHAIAEWRRFENDHERAKRRYIAGQHRVLFPHGTYGYREVLGVRVAKARRAAS